MRLAVVAAPLVETAGSLSRSPSARGVDQALEAAGFRVEQVVVGPDLEAEFERALAGVGEHDELLVYAAGATTAFGKTVLLRLDAQRVLRLGVLGEAVAVREPKSALFVIEALHDGAPKDVLFAADRLDAITQELETKTRGFSVLVGVRPAVGCEPSEWPFTDALVRALQDPELTDDDGGAPISRVYARMRVPRMGEAELGTVVQCFALMRGRADFPIHPAPVVLPAHASVAPLERTPASVTLPQSSARPHLMPLLLGAEEACERAEWDEALDAYKKALMLVSPDDHKAKASIYCAIGKVKRGQGKPREAELNFEKALAEVPGHKGSLDELVDLATEEKDFGRALSARTQRLDSLSDESLRVAELLEIAAVQEKQLGDPRAATLTLERAHGLAPDDREVTAQLRALYTQLQRWGKVVDLLESACAAQKAKVDRAALRFEQADIVLERLRDEARATELLEQALDDDPRHEKALSTLIAVRSSKEQWGALDQMLTRLIDRYAKLGDKARAWDACRRLGALRRDQLRDGPGAIEAYMGAVALVPDDAEARTMLAELFLSGGKEAEAVLELERVAEASPVRASNYQRLFALHARGGRRDRAWLAAQAIEELGAADAPQRVMLDQFRPDGPIRAAATLDDQAWDQLLGARGKDHVVTGVLGAIVAAAVKAKVAELRAQKKLITLDPEKKQKDVHATTASLVRTFAWASQVLGVTLPDLYFMDGVPGGIAAAQVEVPSTVVAPELASGLSAQELAFLAGRHLAYYRPEHYALVFFPTLAELSVLFLAAVKLALPEVPVPLHLSEPVVRMRRDLAQHISKEEGGWLATAVTELETRGGRVDLAAFIRATELTAGRAGYLLAGELLPCARRVRMEMRSVAQVTTEERRHDLLSFSASHELAELRRILGVVARPSTMPPPPSRSSRPPPVPASRPRG